MIEFENSGITIRKQSRLLDLHRSAIYYTAKTPVDDSEIMNKIHEIWLNQPTYGYRPMTAALQKEGYNINRKRAYRLMKLMNLQALYCKPKLSVSNPEHKIYPYLLKGLIVNRPNQVWCTDITYIKMPKGFVYLVAIIDVYSRYIVSWRLSTSLDAVFCLDMLQSAFCIGVPDIVNTDQGCQFTSKPWIALVESIGCKVSMDGKGRWADNVPIERFWRTLKHEEILLKAYEAVGQVRDGIGRFVNKYNNERLHQNLGYETPGDVYGGVVKAPDYFLGKFKKHRQNAKPSSEEAASAKMGLIAAPALRRSPLGYLQTKMAEEGGNGLVV